MAENKTPNKKKAVNKKRKCFVIMPFTKDDDTKYWDNIYKNLIKPSVSASGYSYQCERSQIRGGSFIKDIIFDLNAAHVVLADLTDMNPNVFYELGVRHTLKNRTILISQDLKWVPSDLQSYGVIIYKPDISGLAKFKKEIRGRFKEIEDNPEKADNPVADFLKEKIFFINEYERYSVIRRLKSLESELLEIANIAKVNLDCCKNASVDFWPFVSICIEKLIKEQYVDLDRLYYKMIKVLYFYLLRCNIAIDIIWKSLKGHQILQNEGAAASIGEWLNLVGELSNALADPIKKTAEGLEKENYTPQPPSPVTATIFDQYEGVFKITLT